jgi:multicomponent Na+:H+ antiporter subunit D
VTTILPLIVVLPLIGAALDLLLVRSRLAQRVVTVSTVLAVCVLAVVLLIDVESHGTVAVQIGGWQAPMGITLVADLMAAMFLTVSLLTVVFVLVFAIGQGADERSIFHPCYLVLIAGVAGSFLAGDLFNLFVCFEIMLIASYVLITLGATKAQVRAGMTYVVINLTASTLFVTGVAFIYAATGTLNFADLAERFPGLPDHVRLAMGLVFLAVFGVKAAVFPLFGWLPDSYPTAPTSVTAVFSGLLTKVGVYAIIRSQTIFDVPELSGFVLVVAGLTMVVGVVGAIAQDDVKRILSFHIISQIGYMVMGLGLYSLAGLAATVLYVVHHIPVKTVLFLVSGLVEQVGGSSALQRLGGLLHRTPVIAILFLPPALSLAGIPPFSGFVAKLALVEAGLGAEKWVIVAVSLVVSLLTLVSMTKIWSGVFWGDVEVDHAALAAEPVAVADADSGTPRRSPALMIGATAGAVALTLAIAVAAGPLYDMSSRAATDLLDTTTYIDAVTGGGGS